MADTLEARECATGLEFPEGPVARPDGSTLLVEIHRGTLSRVGTDGKVTVVADLGGGPNGAAMGPDGACYVVNNGGFLWTDVGEPTIPLDLATGSNEPPNFEGGWVARVDLDGRELATLVPLVVLCFWIGIYPETFLRFLHGPANQIAATVQPGTFAPGAGPSAWSGMGSSGEAVRDERDVDPDPMAQFARWYDEAVTAGVPEPEAMSVATATDGVPSARMVLLKAVDARGFVFFTNLESTIRTVYGAITPRKHRLTTGYITPIYEDLLVNCLSGIPVESVDLMALLALVRNTIHNNGRGYGVVVGMDGDGSHEPEHLPSLVGATPEIERLLNGRVRDGHAPSTAHDRDG